jgi:nucleotide-binding universal stress UspA family protein
MASVRRILCAVDFSDFSRRALDLAVAIAGRYGADATALYVAAPRTPPDPPALARVRAELDAFVAPTRTPGVCVRTAVEEGSSADTIVRWARQLPGDIVVTGTHGAGGFDAFAMGSVAEQVLRAAPCPVLTVSKPRQEAFPLEAGRLSEVVCAVDLTEDSRKTLALAESTAQACGAPLTLLHVLEDLQEEPAVARAGLDPADYRARRCANARRRLRAIADGIGVHEKVVKAGHPADEILRFAEDRRAGLIVVGAHGGRIVDFLRLGSTSNEVVRGAGCPVLIVRGRR